MLGWAALVAIGLGGGPGQARACRTRPAKPAASKGAHAPTVQSQQVLNPTSLVPQLPPLVPASTPAPAPPGASIAAPAAPSPLVPAPAASPPAAEALTPTGATPPPDVASWRGTAAPTCACTCPPATVPAIEPPPLPPSPPAPLQPPSAGNVSTPEPSTILSALLMVGATAAWRRRARRDG